LGCVGCCGAVATGFFGGGADWAVGVDATGCSFTTSAGLGAATTGLGMTIGFSAAGFAAGAGAVDFAGWAAAGAAAAGVIAGTVRCAAGAMSNGPA